MAAYNIQYVNIGTTANDGTGDPFRTGFDKLNDNWTQMAALMSSDDASFAVTWNGDHTFPNIVVNTKAAIGWANFSGAATTTSTGGLGLITGVFTSAFPASSTNAYIGVNNTGGDGNLAGDLLYKTRDLANCSHRFFGSGGEVFSINGTNGEVDASTGGVYFGGTAAANLLDDYEEKGTFTPTLIPASGSGITYSVQRGRYTKIGERVFFEVYIILSSTGTASGNIDMGSLPFSWDATDPTYPPLSVESTAGMSITAGQSLSASIISATTVRLHLWDATTGATRLQASEITNSFEVRISGHYNVA